MVLIAEDANAKLGHEWIRDDPHSMSENGKLLAEMIQRQGLFVVNTSEKCKGGPITRCRTISDKIKQEASCIDFIIISKDLAKDLENALIDSSQLYSLTKYTTTKGCPSVKRSDHFTFVANFSVSWTETKSERVEFFKLRDEEGLAKFNRLSSVCTPLKKCVEENVPLEDACSKWYKNIEKLMFQCFKKIRITDKPPKNSIDFPIYQLLEQNKVLKQLLGTAVTFCKPTIMSDIENNERNISILQGNKCRDIITEATKELSINGVFNHNAAWKLKKKLFPKYADAPYAVYNSKDQLITNSEGILAVMKEEFAYRLRNRVINHEYTELKELKEYLCMLRLQITKQSDFYPWTISELEIAIGKLKMNKCRDPHGHINELYKALGIDGLQSLLSLLNRIKQELLIPSKLKLSNVSTIYKGKGSKKDVVNLRGIFKLPIIRNILDKLIYHQDQEVIHTNMGQFQVGNQKDRSIRDHTFIIHAVVNEARIRGIQIDIQFTDIKQCFDSIWLEDAINDLYLSGVQSRNLNLLYEGNRSTEMCVETKFGKSKRVTLNNIVMQGSVSGGTICSNQISKICNKTYDDGSVYMYGGIIPIPALAMVDDLANVSLCNSVDGIKKNVKTDEFVKYKKLESQVGDGKCQWIHIGGGTCESVYKANDSKLTQCEVYKYLGDHVADGWEPLYKKRCEKTLGYAITCQAMCTEISLGHQLFSTAKLLHQSIFLNGTLLNMETWPHFTEKRICEFERIEQGFFRKILSAHSKTPIECLYLELGVAPFRFKLMSRRITYYHNIIHRSENEITRKIMLLQSETKYNGDVFQLIQQNMDQLGIGNRDVYEKSKESLKNIIDIKIAEVAFKYLHNIAKSHSKVKHEMYNDLNGMSYLNDTRFTTEQAKLLFKFRTRMFDVRNNFRNNYACTSCPLCGVKEDTQEHLLNCVIIKRQYATRNEYTDIFSNDCNVLQHFK